jgi:hypothetical protein
VEAGGPWEGALPGPDTVGGCGGASWELRGKLFEARVDGGEGGAERLLDRVGR